MPSAVHDHVDGVSAVVFFVVQNVTSNFNEVTIQHAIVPASEYFVHFLVRHPQTDFHHLVGLADHLHVAVLDAVVHHFYEVPCSALADPLAARFAFVSFGGDVLKDWLHVRPRLWASAGHDAGAFQGSFFTARNTGADVQDSFFTECLRAAFAVGELAVAAVNDDVTLF